MVHSIFDKLIVASETVEKVVFDTIEVPTLESIKSIIVEINSLFSLKSPRDKMFVNIIDEVEADNVEFFGDISVQEVIELFESSENLSDKKECLKLRIDIFKSFEERISIYSIDKFTKGIVYVDEEKNSKRNLKGIIDYFELLFVQGKNKFELIVDEGELVTNAFSFQKYNGTASLYTHNREDKLKNMYDNCNHIGKEKFILCPDDYHVKNKFNSLTSLIELFEYMKLIYSTIFLSNLSEIEDETINFRIDGYKRIKDKYNTLELYSNINKIDVGSIYNIYSWVYEENSNLTERIGLARNIMSLHVKENKIYSLDNTVLPSIKSGYEIYLKENVDNYISILNQVVLLLNQLDQEAMKIADSFSSKFKGNFISFITFFISTILLTTISSGDLSNIFTTEVTIISLGFLFISLIYYIVSLLEFNKNIERLKKLYNRNKDQYGVVLNTEDLKRIFNIKNENEDREEITNLKDARLRISILWITSLIILLTVVLLSNYGFYISV